MVQQEAMVQQLNMMATIYGCATLTIIAMTDNSANAGPAGVSVPRPTQVKETIDGYSSSRSFKRF